MKNILTILFIALLSISSFGMELHMNLNDLISNAHVILIGKCSEISTNIDDEHSQVINTKVKFISLEIVRENSGLVLASKDSIEISYFGGETPKSYMNVAVMPHFEVGTSYMLFLLSDGQKYISPLVGGNQGLFQIIIDEVTGEKYVLDVNQHGVTSIEELEIQKSRYMIQKIVNGVPHFIYPDKLFGQSDDSKDSNREDSVSATGEIQDNNLLSLTKFSTLIKAHVFNEPSLLKWKVNAKPMPSLLPENPSNGNHKASTRLYGTLGACGYQEVYIGLEKVPASWPSYSTDVSCISSYDVYMNIYSNSYVGTPGTYGANNSESEICGWLADQQLHNTYGYHWGTAIGMTINYSSCACCEIVESDIAFNPSYSWVFDWNNAYLTNNINYRNVIMHELGHTWGYQDGGNYVETYDYNQPSVMHSYYNSIWEDGKEIHSRDAYIYRNVYDNQIAVVDVDDVGVESYYASGGLNNSFPSTNNVQSGGSFKINNTTVENNSDDAQGNVHVRFYLSTNRSLGNSDYPVGDFNLGTIAAESRLVNDYTILTTGVPSGTYYVCAKVTINGYHSDDRPANDITWFTFTIHVSGGVGITETDDSYQLNIFPNPAHEKVSVVLPGNFTDYDVNLFDVNGKLIKPVYNKSMQNPSILEIEIRDLPRGIYMLILSDQKQESFKGKILKQ